MDNQYLFSVLILLVIAVLLLAYRLIKANHTKDFEFLSKLCKAIMLLGIGSMAVV
jgi:4-hydroxybenzoate polyprenyltransferase